MMAIETAMKLSRVEGLRTCRAASPDLCEVVRKLANILEGIPDGTSFDMEKLLMLTTLDSIGKRWLVPPLKRVTIPMIRPGQR